MLLSVLMCDIVLFRDLTPEIIGLHFSEMTHGRAQTQRLGLPRKALSLERSGSDDKVASCRHDVIEAGAHLDNCLLPGRISACRVHGTLSSFTLFLTMFTPTSPFTHCPLIFAPSPLPEIDFLLPGSPVPSLSYHFQAPSEPSLAVSPSGKLNIHAELWPLPSTPKSPLQTLVIIFWSLAYLLLLRGELLEDKTIQLGRVLRMLPGTCGDVTYMC